MERENYNQTTKNNSVTSGKQKQNSKKYNYINPYKVNTNPKTIEEESKEKILTIQKAYNEFDEKQLKNAPAVDTKGLSKTQRTVISTALGLVVVTAVIVPAGIYLNKMAQPFEIGVSTNYDNTSQQNHTMEIKPGTKISELDPVKKEGYIFKGWYKDAACTIAYDADYRIQKDDMVFALLIEEVKDFLTTLHYNGQGYAIEVDTSMTFAQVQELFLSQLGMTQSQFETQEGKHYLGLFKDENGTKPYSDNYIMTTEDKHIYALFGINEYEVVFPKVTGVTFEDTAGNPIKSQTLKHGQILQFKVFLGQNFFQDDDFAVLVNGKKITPSSETYTIIVTEDLNIQVDGVFESEVISRSLNVDGEEQIITTYKHINLAEILSSYDLSEENTMGFYADENYTNFVDVTTATLGDVSSLYTKKATLDKLTITSAGVVKAQSTSVSGEIVVPRKKNGKLTSIYNSSSYSSGAFYNCTAITDVYLPYGMTSTGQYAFYKCSALTSVRLPQSVTTISKYTFYYCTGLTSISIPESVTTIDSDAFYNCKGLTGVYITNVNKWATINFGNYSGSNPLYNAKNLYVNNELVSEITLSGITKISNYAFLKCANITKVNLPNTLTSIGSSAFSHCTGLTEIVIPDSVTSLSTEIFYNCTALTSAVLSKNIEKIPNWTFYGCTSLSELEIPQGVTAVGNSVFSNCTALKSVTVPNTVRSFGSSCFYACSGMTAVYIDDIDNWATMSFVSGSSNPINYAKKLYVNNELITEATLSEDVESISDYAFYNCRNIKKLTLPKSITSIGYEAFRYCQFTSITIPRSVKSFGSYAFRDCTALSSVILEDGLSVLGSNMFYNCTALKSITIPGSVKSINSYVFYKCTKLASVTFEAGVTAIGDYMFYGCTALTDVIMSNGIQSIGTYAFRDCTSLKDVKLPSGITSIGNSAFYNCTALETINIPDTVETLGSGNFSQSTNLKFNVYENGKYLGNSTNPYKYLFAVEADTTEFTIHDNCEVIYYRAFYNNSTITKVTLGENLKYIDEYAFQNSSVQNIVFNDNIQKIGENAFSGCTSLTYNVYENCNYLGSVDNPYILLIGATSTEINEVKIHENTTTIGYGAFKDCVNLSQISFHENIHSIGRYAFQGCTALTSVVLPDTITFVGSGAFKGCTSLSNVTLSKSLDCISASMFYECTSLRSITLHEGITSINSSAFYKSGLTSITFPSTLTTISSYSFAYTNITSLVIHDNITTLEYHAFSYCEKLSNVVIGDGITQLGAVFNSGNRMRVTLGKNVTRLSGTFCGTTVTHMNIPKSVTYIGTAFCQESPGLDVGKLESATIEDPNGWYKTPSEEIVLTAALINSHCCYILSKTPSEAGDTDPNGTHRY